MELYNILYALPTNYREGISLDEVEILIDLTFETGPAFFTTMRFNCTCRKHRLRVHCVADAICQNIRQVSGYPEAHLVDILQHISTHYLQFVSLNIVHY